MKDFSKPTVVADLDIAFSVAGGPSDKLHLMPAMREIPDEFKGRSAQWNTWVKFQQTWFFHGLPLGKIKPKPGIDVELAIRHLKAIQKSWEPSAEHKEAAVAYLASLWLESWT